MKIDRIDNKGDIREHSTLTGTRTLCGLALSRGWTQPALGNRPCKRCEKITASCQKSAPLGVIGAER